MLLLLWLAGGAAAQDPCDDPDQAAQLSERMQALADADRTSAGRDERLAQLRELDRNGLICTTEDGFLAAGVLRRGTADDVVRAHALAQAADALGIDGAGWLVAVTADRVAADRGLPQPYGSLTAHQDGKVCLYRIDTEVSDAERRAYDIRSLEATYARVLKKNGLAALPPVAETLLANGLFCRSRVPGEEPSWTATTPAPPGRQALGVSVTGGFGPLLMAGGSLAVEGSATSRLGVAILGGGGASAGHPAWAAGASVRGYPLGNFLGGMQLGLDAIFVAHSYDVDGRTFDSKGLVTGPFLGAKLAADPGLTVEAQAGFAAFVFSGRTGPGALELAEGDVDFGPIVRAALGWTF